MSEKFQVPVTGVRWQADSGQEFMLVTGGPLDGWLCKQDVDGLWVPDYMPSEAIKQSILKNAG
jgi:hypothetical protein